MSCLPFLAFVLAVLLVSCLEQGHRWKGVWKIDKIHIVNTYIFTVLKCEINEIIVGADIWMFMVL